MSNEPNVLHVPVPDHFNLEAITNGLRERASDLVSTISAETEKIKRSRQVIAKAREELRQVDRLLNASKPRKSAAKTPAKKAAAPTP